MELVVLIGVCFWILLEIGRYFDAKEGKVSWKRTILLTIRDTVLIMLGVAGMILISRI